MIESREVWVLDKTNLRRGVSTKGDQDASNLILPPLSENYYTALAQCTGENVTDPHDSHLFNHWWVLLETIEGRGWVNATRIDGAASGKPIDGVSRVETAFETDFDFPARTVTVAAGGATLRQGGSRQSDPGNALGKVDAGPCRALAQCGGQEVRIGNRNNFRWVLLDTAQGRGWVSAVLIEECPSGGRVPHLEAVPTVDRIPSRVDEFTPERSR